MPSRPPADVVHLSEWKARRVRVEPPLVYAALFALGPVSPRLGELLQLPHQLFAHSDRSFASSAGANVDALAIDVLLRRLDPNTVRKLPEYAIGVLRYAIDEYVCMLDRSRRVVVVEVVGSTWRRGFEAFERRLEVALGVADDLSARGERFTLVVQSEKRELIC